MAVSSIIQSDGDRVAVIDLLNPDVDETAAAVAKVDPATLAPNAKGQACTGVRVMVIRHTTAVNGLDLYFEATVDQLAWIIGLDDSGHLDFRSSGYLRPSNVLAAGFTGVILFQQRGAFSAGNSGYSVRLELEKLYG